MERKIDELLTIAYMFGLLYLSGLEHMPVWFRLVAAVGVLIGVIDIFLIWVLQWLDKREERKNK